MCNACIDFEAELNSYQEKLESLEALIEVSSQMKGRDASFADDLINGFRNSHALSAKQWYWVGELVKRVKSAEPIYGNLAALWVAFKIAGEKLKQPKIRLLADDGSENGIYVQLNFCLAGSKDYRGEVYEEDVIKVYTGGWSGHGRRLYAGSIKGDRIYVFRDRMPEAVRNIIQDLSMDPMGVAKAMANKLGICLYCGSRLSDPESKKRGYGPTCAANYNMPWGNKRLHREAELEAQSAQLKAQAKGVVGN